jgi:hypothetical protein
MNGGGRACADHSVALSMMNWLVFSFLAICALVRSFGAETISQTIYDNSDNYEADYFNTLLEVGDQVQFARTNRMINNFQFMCFTRLAKPLLGSEQARVRFYLNDGLQTTNGFAAPGTLIYDSGEFNIGTNIQTVEISDIAVIVPGDTLTWTVQFSGFSTNERGGVLFYNPPALGSSANFLWQHDTNGWTQIAQPGLVNNFFAHFTAVPAPFERVQIQSMQVSGENAILTASATIGKFYWIEYKDSVDQAGWTTLNVPPVQAAGDQVTLADPGASEAAFRVYRVTQRDSGIVGEAEHR